MTNPPVPATPLDVEACVRLLERLAGQAAGRAVSDSDYADMHERSHPHIATDHHASAAKYMEEARLLSALASALPGMGKDSEPAVADVIAWMEARPGCSWMASVADIHEAVGAIRRARAAQPEETSADG